jgi:hypothetical protein
VHEPYRLFLLIDLNDGPTVAISPLVNMLRQRLEEEFYRGREEFDSEDLEVRTGWTGS